MKKIYFLLIALCFFATTKAQIVNIPDANFKKAIINTLCVDTDLDGIYERDADLNNDGEIQNGEANIIQRLKISNNNISNLTGILNSTNKYNSFLKSCIY